MMNHKMFVTVSCCCGWCLEDFLYYDDISATCFMFWGFKIHFISFIVIRNREKKSDENSVRISICELMLNLQTKYWLNRIKGSNCRNEVICMIKKVYNITMIASKCVYKLKKIPVGSLLTFSIK